MIVQIGLAIAMILAGGLFALQGSSIATGVVAELMAPFTNMLQTGMLMAAHLAPVLVAALPAWLVFKDEGEAKPMALTWGVVYGVLLFGLIQYTGIDIRLVQAVQQSYTGSLVGGLGVIAQFTWGILTVATYYLAGIALAIFSVVLEVITGIGYAAQQAKGRVNRAQENILSRIIRRLTK
mgnify:CR=1 FL=1